MISNKTLAMISNRIFEIACEIEDSDGPPDTSALVAISKFLGGLVEDGPAIREYVCISNGDECMTREVGLGDSLIDLYVEAVNLRGWRLMATVCIDVLVENGIPVNVRCVNPSNVKELALFGY